MTTRKLGHCQVAALRTLDRPPFHYERGVWGPRSGWTWGTTTGTDRMMKTLVDRGLMTSTPSESGREWPTYRLTPAGEEAIIQLKAADWEVK